MKTGKVLILCGFLMGFYQMNGQISRHALGVRIFGDNDGYADGGSGLELSYQYGFGEHLRGEVDLGFKNSRFIDVVKLTGLIQGVWNIQDGFYWYTGGGFGIGAASYDPSWPQYDRFANDGTALLALDGDVGIEYNFAEFPLQLAFDIRPEVFLLDAYYDDFNINMGFAIRYRFD